MTYPRTSDRGFRIAGCILLCLHSWLGTISVAMELGLCEDYPEETRTIEAAERDLELCGQLGVRILRVGMGWDGIETAPQKYDWAFWDQLVERAQRRSIRLAPYVCFTPQWAVDKAGKDHWKHPPKRMDDWRQFMRAAAERYRGRILSWEIWNEPDNSDFWRGSRPQYAQLLRAGAAGVREADPQARVVLGGIAWELRFLETLWRDKANRVVDVVNLHSYFETWSPEPQERLSGFIGQAADILGGGKAPAIWLAETGYSDFHRGDFISSNYSARYAYEHTADFQAQALLRTVCLAAATGRVELLAWYRIHDLPAGQQVIGDQNNRHLGLLTIEGKPKPALEAMRLAGRLFAQSRPLHAETLVTAPSAWDGQVHVFEQADGRVFAVCWLATRVAGRTADAADSRRQAFSIQLARPMRLETATDATHQPIPPPTVRVAGQSTHVDSVLEGGKTLVWQFAPLGTAATMP